MDRVRHFRRETAAFEAAARQVTGDAPIVPSCPEWSVADLVLHLGMVHRLVITVVRDRMAQPPDPADLAPFAFPAGRVAWPEPDRHPTTGPLADGLVDWFADGARQLAVLFAERDAADPAWTWWSDHTVGFWVRMQSIEAAVHRWDAQRAVGTPEPIDRELAEDAVVQTLTVMAPGRRMMRDAPKGTGERFGFRQTDGAGRWTLRFDGDDVRIVDEDGDVGIAGTASDLALYLWQRLPAGELTVTGDTAVLDRYFTLAPPV